MSISPPLEPPSPASSTIPPPIFPSSAPDLPAFITIFEPIFAVLSPATNCISPAIPEVPTPVASDIPPECAAGLVFNEIIPLSSREVTVSITKLVPAEA